ncbi:MAG: hypothetical protein WCK59_04225 [Candidatus Falkowbacteria bacterium]
MRNLVESFNPENLDPQINWLNDLLAEFLKVNLTLKMAFDDYFIAREAESYEEGVKKFNLERWSSCGSDSNPTLEIVEIKGELKFAYSAYGTLGPLKSKDYNRAMIKSIVAKFFAEPLSFFK